MNKVTGPYRIGILRTDPQIGELREFWNACHPRRDADLDFFLFIVQIYRDAERPHVVVLYEGDVPKALLAARLETGYVPVRLGYFALPVPKLRILQIVHGGWLGDITAATSKWLIGSILDSLAKGEADAASLHCPDIHSPLVQAATALPYRWCADRCIDPQARRVRDLSGAPGSFVASLSQNERYQQRKRARHLTEAFGDSRIACFSTVADIDTLMRDAEIIAAKSYQRGLNVGFSDTPVIRSRLAFEAGKGWMRGYILYLDGQPCAFWIGSLRDGIFLSEYLCFDAAYAKYAPGMYLIVKVIESLNDAQSGDPVRLIDFGIGDTSYKERLANRHWQESAVYIFAPRIKAVWVNALRTCVGALNRSARDVLRWTPWLAGVKRTWRARAARSER